MSSSWPIPPLSTMSSALLHFFYVACGWQWITKTQRGMPSVAIGSECFPWLWRDVEARHVTLDDDFVAQFGSASSTRRVIELAVEDILGRPSSIRWTWPSQRRRRCLMIVVRSYEPVRCMMVELGTWSLHETPRMERRHLKWTALSRFSWRRYVHHVSLLYNTTLRMQAV